MSKTSPNQSPIPFTVIPPAKVAPHEKSKTVPASASGDPPSFPGTSSSLSLTETTDGSQPLPNARHEQFAQGVASGRYPSQAYTAVFGGERETKRYSAYRLERRADVALRITYLQKSLSARNLIEREEVVRLLVDIIRATPSEASMDSPLCDGRKNRDGDYPVFMDKVKAIERLSKIMGWDAPQKVTPSVRNQGEVFVLTEERRRILIEKKLRAMEENGRAPNNANL